jgi:CHAD domain-containing protein
VSLLVDFPPHPSMNVRTPYDGLWSKRLVALNKAWPGFVAGETDALHEVRVASRRIREALPVVGASAPAAKVKKLRRKLRRLTRLLGPIRELDVELGLIETQAANGGVPSAALALVRREVASRRQALRRELKDDDPVGDLKKLLRKLEKVARAKDDHQDAWRGAMAASLVRRAKTLASALDHAGPMYAPERIHGVRVAIKKVRYALEIAQHAGQSGVKALITTLKREQERLGHLHDLQALLKHVHDAKASRVSAARLAELTAYADGLERDCRRLHAEFVDLRNTLFDGVDEIRRVLIPALTTAHRQQARVAHTQRLFGARVRKRA